MYKHVKTRKHDDFIAGQIDFARQQEQNKKNRIDLDQIEKIFTLPRQKTDTIDTDRPINVEGINCKHTPYKKCEFCEKDIPKKLYTQKQYKKRKYCGMSCSQNAQRNKAKGIKGKVGIENKPENNHPLKSIIAIKLKNGLFEIDQDFMDDLAGAFPHIDLFGELKRIQQWNESNPARRKTKTGIKRHIFTWLSNCNNKPIINISKVSKKPVSRWDDIQTVLAIHNLDSKIIEKFKKYYDLGFKHGNAFK